MQELTDQLITERVYNLEVGTFLYILPILLAIIIVSGIIILVMAKKNNNKKMKLGSTILIVVTTIFFIMFMTIGITSQNKHTEDDWYISIVNVEDIYYTRAGSHKTYYIKIKNHDKTIKISSEDYAYFINSRDIGGQPTVYIVFNNEGRAILYFNTQKYNYVGERMKNTEK